MTMFLDAETFGITNDHRCLFMPVHTGGNPPAKHSYKFDNFMFGSVLEQELLFVWLHFFTAKWESELPRAAF